MVNSGPRPSPGRYPVSTLPPALADALGLLGLQPGQHPPQPVMDGQLVRGQQQLLLRVPDGLMPMAGKTRLSAILRLSTPGRHRRADPGSRRGDRRTGGYIESVRIRPRGSCLS